MANVFTAKNDNEVKYSSCLFPVVNGIDVVVQQAETDANNGAFGILLEHNAQYGFG